MLEPDTTNELNTQIQYRLIEKLTASERRYRERVENLREIVFECDRAGRVIFVNRAWTDTLGHQISKTIGQSLAGFIDKRDVERWQTILRQQTDCQTFDKTKHLSDDKINCHLELRFPHQTGSIFWLELAIQFNQEEILSGSLINVTERKQAEAILQQANEELESRVQQRTAELSQANQALTTTLAELRSTQGQLIQTERMSSLGQLVAGVAHEINNPVSFVYGNLQPARNYAQNILMALALYQDRYPTPSPQIADTLEELDIEFIRADFPKLLRSMEIGTQRIKAIVSSLRNFSRLDESDFKTVDIHEGLENTLLILNHRLKANLPHEPISVSKNYGELPLVQCFPSQLNQVFMNLLSNAIDAIESNAGGGKRPSAPPPTVTIQTETMGDSVVITIADNGTGIPSDILPRVFDPFFTTKPIGKGTGLGLSISHQIITEKHSGTLTCQSVGNEGTAFTIQIPLSSQQKKSDSSVASAN